MEFDQEELLALTLHDMEQGHLEAALHKMKQLLQQDEPSPRCLAIAAKLYARLRLFTHAKGYYERYLTLDPKSEEMTFEFGMVNLDLGSPDIALGIWSGLLEQTPTFPPALFFSALTLSRQSRVADAKRHLDVLLQTAASDNLYYSRSQELLKAMEAQVLQQSGNAAPSLMSKGQ